MKVLIVGFGSMGKRRARLIKGVINDVELCCADTQPSRQKDVDGLGVCAYSTISDAVKHNKFDAAFVCTSPKSHAAIISELLLSGINVFTELNLINDGYETNLRLAKEKDLVLFLSNTMIYRKEPQYLISEIRNFAKPVNYTYHIGQYLPDWHPWENYKSFFVKDKRTGGIREIFGIDFPWILRAFGEVEDICVQKNTLSDLDVPFHDSCTVMLKHKNGSVGVFMADVVSPKAVRNFEAYGDGLHLFWEGNPNALYKYNVLTKEKEFVDTYAHFDQDARYSDNVVETAYVDEIICFFDVLAGKKEPLYTFDEDAAAIAIMDKIDNM